MESKAILYDKWSLQSIFGIEAPLNRKVWTFSLHWKKINALSFEFVFLSQFEFLSRIVFFEKIMKLWILLPKFDFSVILLVFGSTHEASFFDLEKLIFGSTKFWNYLQKAKSPYNLFLASEEQKIAPLSKRRYFFSKIAFFSKKLKF